MINQLIHILVYVLVGLLACFCAGLFISDQRVMTVIRIIVFLMVVLFSLQVVHITL